MKTIMLISCCSKKLPMRAEAESLYTSDLFKLSLDYAKNLNPDHLLILSAKHGLLTLNEMIHPYDITLDKMPKADRIEWAQTVIRALSSFADFRKDKIVFLAGRKYREHLLPYLENYEIPMEGLSIGRQLQFLKQQSEQKNICCLLHGVFNKIPKLLFPYDENLVPLNGIYILFEKGEKAHGGDRITRVGTHRGNNQLRARLAQHFIKEDKDRSIFRKNIGRCLLNKHKDAFLKYWELDLTTKAAKIKYNSLVDHGRQAAIEKEVSKYIQSNFSFITLAIDNPKQRHISESKLISTVSLCKTCVPSANWLGNFSPKKQIRGSGLWQVNELYKTALNKEELAELVKCIRRQDHNEKLQERVVV